MNWSKMLDAKVALVTGGGSGIGRATAQVFAEHGASVMVADVNGASAEQTVAGILAAGGDATFQQTDVGKMQDVERMVQQTVERYGRLDVVLSNAAGYQLGRPRRSPRRTGIAH